MRNGNSLTSRFSVTFLVMVLLFQGFGSVLFIVSVRNSMVDSLNEKMMRAGEALQGVTVNPILNNDTKLLTPSLEKFFNDKDFVSLSIFDRNKNLLGEKTRLAKKSSRINPFYIRASLKKEVPVLSGSEKIGNIVIVSSPGKINNETFKYMVFSVLYLIFFSVFIVFFVSVFINRNIREPLSVLGSAVNRAGNGDLTVKIESVNNPEIASIINGVNSLIARVKYTLQKLHANTVHVTGAIMQINSAMDKVRDGTHNQANFNDEVVTVMERNGNLQKEILDSSLKLTELSKENLPALNQLKVRSENIVKNTKELSQSSSDSFSTIAEISASAKEIAKSTEELAMSTDKTSTSVMQISANIQEVDNSSKESARLANKVREIAAEWGMLTVADAMGGMDEIKESVDKSLEIIKNLTGRSRDIEKILSVISDVTKQTNLLSVNAAILAAQAGEYGKGFLVVADEIKALAERTVVSTKEITGIIKSIQNGIAEITQVTEGSKIIVENANAFVVKTGEAFREVINSAQKSSAMTDNIKKATEEQVQGIQQIKESMEAVLSTVEHTARATREQKIGSEHLLTAVDQSKEGSEVMDREMDEQVLEIRFISENFNITNEKIEHLNETILKHKKINEEIILITDRIMMTCKDTITITKELTAPFDTLYKAAEAMKEDMGGFRLE